MKEDLISFETAKLAKEKGFGKTLDHIYPWSYKNVSVTEYVLELNSQNNTLDTHISAPTQSLLQRWLREEHNLHIELSIDLFDDLETMCFRGFHIIKMNNYKNLYKTNEVFKTYEEALEAGLQEALKLI